MDQNKDKWIKDAFEKATSDAGKMEASEPKTKARLEKWAESFPAVLMAVKDTMGDESAMLMLTSLFNRRMLDIFTAIYLAGYKDGESEK